MIQQQKLLKQKQICLTPFFETVFVKDNGASMLANFKVYDAEESEFNILSDGVLKLLNNIKTNKSCGPDDLTGVLLKTFSICIANALTRIFQYSLETSSLPDV